MRATIVLGLATVVGLAFAATTSYSIVVNGQVASKKAMVIDGETYVPLSSLKALGVSGTLKGTTLTLSAAAAAKPAAAPAANQTAGGSNQKASLEGCIGETLFNGIWRLKVTKVEAVKNVLTPDAAIPGWGVTLELRNGASATLQPVFTGVGDFTLALADGNVLPASIDAQKFQYANLPQGALVSGQVKFYYPGVTRDADVQKATKLLINIDTTGFADSMKRAKVGYTTPTPSFRVNLTCQK